MSTGWLRFNAEVSGASARPPGYRASTQKGKQVTPIDRQQWILNYMRKNPSVAVNILDAEFVTSFIEATGERFVPNFFGSAQCKALSRDLGALFKQSMLRRNAFGLPYGDAAMGFPKWVYMYRL
jgi:hypothetical protein